MAAEIPSDSNDGEPEYAPLSVLLIGLERVPVTLTGRAKIRNVTYAALTSALLYVLRPDLILCPLVHADFDAAQLILRLVAIGYGGRLTVIADIPAPDLVARELADMGPGITVRVVRG